MRETVAWARLLWRWFHLWRSEQAYCATLHKKYGEITNSKYQEVADVSKATATRDIKELENKGLLKNIGTKGSSAIYKLRVGS